MATTNAWLNYISTSLIRDAKTKDGTKTFKSVSVPYSESANGFASITVSAGQVMTSKNKAGVENPAFRNILLGKPDATRKVSICTEAPVKGVSAGVYETIELTNAQIAAGFAANRDAYKKATQPAVETESEIG